ncbi:MAG: GGDEF domain-containing protein [Gammaproteobacteria bacterium]|nr:GGDEF domain-containing protein [Gammaproteobacteria bacterium]
MSEVTSEDESVTHYPFLAAEDAEKAAEHFRLAIAHLGKLQDVTPIPLNYALFYFYVAGVNTRFNAMMDDLIANGAAWDHEAAAALFMRFFTPCSDASMADLQQELLTVLNDIIGSVIDVAGNADQRTERLGQKVALLADCKDPKHSLEIAGDILVEAHELVADSKALAADLRHTSDEVAKLKEELLHARREAYVDVLTGLSNRRAFGKDLAQLIDEATRGVCEFCLVMVDVDFFKRINDEHGHLIGDRVLRQLGKQINARIRSGDKL